MSAEQIEHISQPCKNGHIYTSSGAPIPGITYYCQWCHGAPRDGGTLNPANDPRQEAQ